MYDSMRPGKSGVVTAVVVVADDCYEVPTHRREQVHFRKRSMRSITFRYDDPLDMVWRYAARQWGFQIDRDTEVFAASDGQGRLRIGTPDTLDPDDSLAQIILHELCHCAVAGDAARVQPDWGLTYDAPDDEVYEHAALQLQAALCIPYGLRQFFGATTDYRAYYDRLPLDLSFQPSSSELASPSDRLSSAIQEGDPAHHLARAGWQFIERDAEKSKAIHLALKTTAEIQRLVAPFAANDSLWRADSSDRVN